MDQRLETFLTVCATMNYRKAAGAAAFDAARCDETNSGA